MPSTRICGVVMFDGTSVFGPGSNANTPTVTIVTALFTTGAHAPGPYTLRMFSTAVNIAPSP